MARPRTIKLGPPYRRWEDEALAAISREIGRIHAHNFGNNVTSVDAVWEDDFLLCTLTGALTEAERLLVEHGRFDRVRDDRRALHDPLEPTYRALIETLTGRGVRAYMSEVEPGGTAFEAFILSPASGRD
jgi:uncharacterized protein YbcI